MKNYDDLTEEEKHKMILEESFESCTLKEEEENRKRILDEYYENLIESLSFSEREIFDKQVKEDIDVLEGEITKEKSKHL